MQSSPIVSQFFYQSNMASSGRQQVLRRPAASRQAASGRRGSASSQAASGLRGSASSQAASHRRRPASSSSQAAAHGGRQTSSEPQALETADHLQTAFGVSRFLEMVRSGRARLTDAPCFEMAEIAARSLGLQMVCAICLRRHRVSDLNMRNYAPGEWTAICQQCFG